MSTTAPSLTSREGSSHRQTQRILWIGFGGLLLLMGVLGLSAISFLYQIEIRQEHIRKDYVERDRALEGLRSNIYLSGTYARDFLLDSSDPLAASHKEQFLATRKQIEDSLQAYRPLIRPQQEAVFRQLDQQLNTYLALITPTLEWSTEQRKERGFQFIREEVLPRRMLAVGLADQIQQLSEQQLEISSQEVSELFSSFRVKLVVLLALTVAIGLVLAGIALWRLLHLEHESGMRFEEVLTAQKELQRLSAELLSVQENERRRISRELHDEVGQVLSAMMLGIGNLQSALKNRNMDEGFRQLQLLQDMTEQNASVVRNLSLLLRPTMLDDLGLVPALKWYAREVSRTTTLEVDVVADDCPDNLPEEHRTCVYRVVQEAIRNCCRHAGAHQARIYVQRTDPRNLRVVVQDDGKGFDAEHEKGLGILGMEERVVRLGGTLTVDSLRGRGTIISFDLPIPEAIDPELSLLESTGQDTKPLRTA